MKVIFVFYFKIFFYQFFIHCFPIVKRFCAKKSIPKRVRHSHSGTGVYVWLCWLSYTKLYSISTPHVPRVLTVQHFHRQMRSAIRSDFKVSYFISRAVLKPGIEWTENKRREKSLIFFLCNEFFNRLSICCSLEWLHLIFRVRAIMLFMLFSPSFMSSGVCCLWMCSLQTGIWLKNRVKHNKHYMVS